MPGPYSWRGQDLILNLHIQPRASRDECAGQHGDSIKVRVQSPPVDGKANQRLTAFLAKAFAVAKSQVTILSGLQGRSKRVQIHNPGRLPPEWGVLPDQADN